MNDSKICLLILLFWGIASPGSVEAQDPCGVAAPTDLACFTFEDLLPVELFWTNAEPYDSVLVFRDGVEIAELDGASNFYTDFDVDYEFFGTLAYTVAGVSDTEACSTESEPCGVDIALITRCAELVDADVTSSAPGSFEIEVSDQPACYQLLAAIEVAVEITTTSAADLELSIVSDEGTTVTLLNVDDVEGEDLRVTFSEDGEALTDSTCECAVAPANSLSEYTDLFTGEDVGGTWTLEVSTASADVTVDAFCVELGWSGTAIPLSGGFRRGDADGNGVVFPLGDAFFILDFTFGTGAIPPCMDAADVDGNGQFFGIIDALYLLSWGFIDGLEPPDPGPEFCGIGPGESLGCDVSPPGCGFCD